MREVRNQQKMTKGPESLNNTKLLTLLAKQLKSSEFSQFPYKLQQVGSGDIQLIFDNVAFTPFIKWLKKLNKDYAFSLIQFKANRTDTSGVVSLTLTISAN
jgi:general secretion pathway protein M